MRRYGWRAGLLHLIEGHAALIMPIIVKEDFVYIAPLLLLLEHILSSILISSVLLHCS